MAAHRTVRHSGNRNGAWNFERLEPQAKQESETKFSLRKKIITYRPKQKMNENQGMRIVLKVRRSWTPDIHTVQVSEDLNFCKETLMKRQRGVIPPHGEGL